MLIRGFGVIVANVGHFQATGLCLNVSGAVDTAQILAAIDSHFIPTLRQHFHTITLLPPTACGVELWPYTCAVELHLPSNRISKITIRSTGHFIRQSAASRDVVLKALDTHFLPLVCKQIAEALKN